jgi:hypothetical protein
MMMMMMMSALPPDSSDGRLPGRDDSQGFPQASDDWASMES